MSWTSNTCRRVPIYLLLAILCGTLAVSARTDKPWCVDDPYENPREDTCNPVRYIPQLWGAILSLTLYFVASILLTVQFWRYGGKYFLCLVIGGYCEGIGLTMRIPFRNDPHNTAIYIVQYLFIVLSVSLSCVSCLSILTSADRFFARYDYSHVHSSQLIISC